MNDWQVFRRIPAPYVPVGGCPWRVLNPATRETGTFRTHAQALAYADKQARTHEVVLPRVSYGDHVVAGKGMYSLHVDYREHCTDIYLGGWDGVTVENRHLWDLAMYLAACAQHWKERQNA